MEILIVGIVVFFALHFVPSFRALRSSLLEKLGEGKYKIIYSSIAATGLALIVYGKMRAPYEPLYEPLSGTRALTATMVLLGIYLFIGRRAGSNIKRFTAHPMLWGVSLWAGAHLLANGDLASVLLFGSFLTFSLINMILATRRGVIPVVVHASATKELVIALVSIAIFALLLAFHGFLFGVNLLP